MDPKLKEACLSVAADIEAGTLKPGYYSAFENDRKTPRGTLGHLAIRSGYGWDSWLECLHGTFGGADAYFDRFTALMHANDNGNWPKVCELLRQGCK